MNTISSEMVKYASNAFLATKVAFINEIARLCETNSADIGCVRQGIGIDSRIGAQFLNPGLGFGGSCLPKDVKTLDQIGRKANLNLPIIQNIENSNHTQKGYFIEKVSKQTQGAKRIAIWGISSKPHTDDIREAPSIAVIEYLLDQKNRFICL